MTDASSFDSKQTLIARQPAKKEQVGSRKTFILEEILTLSGLVDLEQGNQDSDATFAHNELLSAVADTPSLTESLEAFESGTFQVTGNGEIIFDFLFDGGGYRGELGIFSLEGMDAFAPNSSDFIREAAQRVSSSTELGHIVISDPLEGAKFSGSFEHEGDFNSGEYLGPKTVTMKPGDRFGLMLVPNGRFQEVLENPEIEGAKRPLFSMATANPEDHFHVGQLADVTGDGNTFVFEDLRVDTGSDEDYNDLVFRVEGTRGQAESLDDYINPDNDWRETVIGQEIIEYAQSFVEPDEPIVVLDPTGATEIPIEDLFVKLPESEAWTYEVVDAGSPELNLSFEEQTLLIEPTSNEIDIEQITIRAMNGDGESIIQRPILILDVPDSETTQVINELLIEAGDVLETLARDADAQSSEGLANLADTLNGLVEEQPRVFKFLVQPDTLLALGIEQPQVDTAYELIHSEVVGQELGLPDSLYEALKKAGSSAWDKLLVEAHDLAELLPYGGLLPLIGFIEFARQGHDHKTLETFTAIHELNDDDYTVKYTDGEDWAEKLTELVDQAISSGTPNAVVNLGLDLAQFDDLEHTTTRYELTPAEQQAIQYAQENNVLLVTAAGNTGDLMSALGTAAQKFDNILVVGAVDRWQEKADYSAQGEGLSLVAPGGEWETDPNAFVGTSKAAAYVTAAVSLLWKANPGLNYQQVKEILLKAADDLAEPGWDPATGAGLMDVAEAIMLAQQTEGQPSPLKAPKQVEAFSGEGRVQTLGRPASDPPISALDLLDASSATYDDFWQKLLGTDETPDSSLGEYTATVLDQYQQLKAEEEILSAQERLLETDLALVEQQAQVRANNYFTLQNQHQSLSQELQDLLIQQLVLMSPSEQPERVAELQQEIASHQQWLNWWGNSSDKSSGVRSELYAYQAELYAWQRLANINETQRQQELARVNLEIKQKQNSLTNLEKLLSESQEGLVQTELDLKNLPNELAAIRKIREATQKSLRSLLEFSGFALPYRERLAAIESQVDYLKERSQELDDTDEFKQNALRKDLEWAETHLDTLTSSQQANTLQQLIAELKAYEANSLVPHDLPAQQYVGDLQEIHDNHQIFLAENAIISQQKVNISQKIQPAKQALEKLWNEHVKLTLDKARLEKWLAYPNLEIFYPAQYQVYKQALAETEQLLKYKYKAIQLTERYVEQLGGFEDKLQNWETFFLQVKEDTELHLQLNQQWSTLSKTGNNIAESILDSLKYLDEPHLKLQHLLTELELEQVKEQLISQQTLLEQLLHQDEILKEKQIYHYSLSEQHKANTWASGFYSESEALADRDNHQQASLIAAQRNKLWVQIQSAFKLQTDLEGQVKDQQSSVDKSTQTLQDAGYEIPIFDSKEDLQAQITSLQATLKFFLLPIFGGQVAQDLSALKSWVSHSNLQLFNLKDALQMRAEVAQKLIAFGLASSESDPNFFYTKVEPEAEEFIGELQFHYEALKHHALEISQVITSLESGALNISEEELNFIKDYLQVLEDWQETTISTVENLRTQLNYAWDSLSMLRQQQHLDAKLKTTRPDLVTTDIATTALNSKSIQGYAQLHDHVADDLVGAVTTWTKQLQTSHQITQDLIAAQITQSQAVDDLIAVMQNKLVEPFGKYRLAKGEVRDDLISQTAIQERAIGFDQELENTESRIEKLRLKLTQNSQLANRVLSFSSANKSNGSGLGYLRNLKSYTNSTRKQYHDALNHNGVIFSNGSKIGIRSRIRQLELELDPNGYNSLPSKLNGEFRAMAFWWGESRKWRRGIGIADDDRPYEVDLVVYKKNKGPFGLITWSKTPITHRDEALINWFNARTRRDNLINYINHSRSRLSFWKSRESKFASLERQWVEADNAAAHAEWQVRQIQNNLDQLKAKADYERPIFLADLAKDEDLLLNLQQQALEAQQEALAIKQSLEQTWEEYLAESQDYREATVDVLEDQSQIDRQALQYRSMLAEVERWLEGQSVTTNEELEHAKEIRLQLEAAIQALQIQLPIAAPAKITEIKTQTAQLQESLALVLSKINVLEARQTALTQKRALVAASDAVVVAEERLLQAYLINPDEDTSALEAELSAARAALAEAQRLAEQAEASSEALTEPLQELRETLLARNDEHIQQAREQQQILKELREATELNLNYTLEATKAQQKVNSIQSQIITKLQQAVDAGNQEALSLLKVAETNDRAALAELYYKDYGDLASDKKFAKPEYRQLADQYYQEWQYLSQIKEQEKQQAEKWQQLRQKAEEQLEVLNGEEAAAQAELDKWNALVAETQEEIEAKDQALGIAKVRLESIEQLRAETERIFIQIASLEELNIAQAQLEIHIAEKRDADIEQSIQDRLAREQQALERKRKVILAQISQLKQIQSEADLQTALNDIRSELGMTDLDIVESPVQLQAQMAELLGQLDGLTAQQPDLPDDLKALLTEVKGDIHLALQGEEAANIQANLLAVADGMVEQIEQYKAELAQIDLENQAEEQLLQLAQSDLQAASQQFVAAAQQNQELRDQLDDLNIEYWSVLEGIAYAQQQVEISEQWAAQAHAALDQMIAQRKEARKQRKKAFWNKVLSAISTVTGIVGTIVSFIPGLQLVGVGLIAASAGINAVQAAVNGDWAGAIFGVVMAGLSAVTAGAGNAIGPIATRALKGIQAVASGTFNGIRSIKSGEGILGALQIVGGAAGAAVQGLSNVVGKLNSTAQKFGYQILNSLQKTPLLIHGGIESIRKGDWLSGLNYITNAAATLGQNFASVFDSAMADFFKGLNSFRDGASKWVTTGKALVNSIKSGSMESWLTGIADISGTWAKDIGKYIAGIVKPPKFENFNSSNTNLKHKRLEGLSNEAYKKHEVGDKFKIDGVEYVVSDTVSNSNNGFSALLLTDEEGNSIISFRGTEELKDLGSDLHPFGVGYNQFSGDKDTIQKWVEHNPGITLTGHSLGGALAQFAAVQFPDSVGEVVTFNSPGLSGAQLTEGEYQDFQANHPHIKTSHYVVEGDLVSFGGSRFIPGDVYMIQQPNGSAVSRHKLEYEDGKVGRLGQPELSIRKSSIEDLNDPDFGYRNLIHDSVTGNKVVDTLIFPVIHSLGRNRQTGEFFRTLTGVLSGAGIVYAD